MIRLYRLICFTGCLLTSLVVCAKPIVQYYFQVGTFQTKQSAYAALKKAEKQNKIKGNIQRTQIHGKTCYEAWVGPYSSIPHSKFLQQKPRKMVYPTPTSMRMPVQTATLMIPEASAPVIPVVIDHQVQHSSLEKDPSPQRLGWRPVVAVGGGAAASSNQGRSQTFPILNPLTDEFYIYTNTTSNKMAGLLDVFIGAEWAYADPWSLQLGIGYDQRWGTDVNGTFIQGADAQSADQYTYRYSVATRQLLAEGKLLYHYSPVILPYAMVGLGASFNKASGYSTNVPPFLTFTRQYQNNNQQSSFSYTLGLGVDANVTDHIRLGVGYRFADFGSVALGSATIDTTPVAGVLSQPHLYTNGVLVQLTWLN